MTIDVEGDALNNRVNKNQMFHLEHPYQKSITY